MSKESLIENFTRREEVLLERVGTANLPERLLNWRRWIGDTQMYLNELRDWLDTNGK